MSSLTRSNGRHRRLAIRALSIAVLIACVTGSEGDASADGGRERTVALVPLQEISDAGRKKARLKLEKQIVSGFRGLSGFRYILPDDVRKRAQAEKHPEFLVCEADRSCLVGLGKLLGADGVVYYEYETVAGKRTVFFKLVGVASGREVRSATADMTGKAAVQNARAAAAQLLAPNRYTGTIKLAVDTAGATIYVDGKLTGTSPSKPLTLHVGPHALRVTHPEFRDFVRFVEVRYDHTEEISVELQKYPVISSEMRRNRVLGGGPAPEQKTPWYRRWYTIAGAGALLLITTAVVVGVVTDGVDADRSTTLR